jgi:hypothetical protein
MFSPQSGAIGALIAAEIGRQGGFTVRDDAWITFASQVQRETGGVVTANNPLNLTDPGHGFLWRAFGQIGHRAGGSEQEWHTNFAAFDSLEGGARAAAANYLGSYYGNVIDALRSQADPVTLARAIESSPWDSGHYGGTLSEAVAAAVGDHGGSTAAALEQPAPLVLPDPVAAVSGAIAGVAAVPGRAIASARAALGERAIVVLLIVLAVVIVASVIL